MKASSKAKDNVEAGNPEVRSSVLCERSTCLWSEHGNPGLRRKKSEGKHRGFFNPAPRFLRPENASTPSAFETYLRFKNEPETDKQPVQPRVAPPKTFDESGLLASQKSGSCSWSFVKFRNPKPSTTGLSSPKRERLFLRAFFGRSRDSEMPVR